VNFEPSNRDIYMAIKNGTSPEPLSSWKRFAIINIVPQSTKWITDYPRVGWDANGVYVTAIGVDEDNIAGALIVKSNFVLASKSPMFIPQLELRHFSTTCFLLPNPAFPPTILHYNRSGTLTPRHPEDMPGFSAKIPPQEPVRITSRVSSNTCGSGVVAHWSFQ
jgi:hypothetical protein